MTVSYESTVINQQEYVTAEQHQKGVTQAAMKGRDMALASLKKQRPRPQRNRSFLMTPIALVNYVRFKGKNGSYVTGYNFQNFTISGTRTYNGIDLPTLPHTLLMPIALTVEVTGLIARWCGPLMTSPSTWRKRWQPTTVWSRSRQSKSTSATIHRRSTNQRRTLARCRLRNRY